jgi:hypothetical protein
VVEHSPGKHEALSSTKTKLIKDPSWCGRRAVGELRPIPLTLTLPQGCCLPFRSLSSTLIEHLLYAENCLQY